MNKSKLLIATALGLTAALGAGLAQARGADVQWSVTIGAPVLVAPVVTYDRPAPVYVEPAPVYGAPPPWAYRHGYRQPTRWDVDGDGVRNRRDRLYNPRWDRDGDGIPNRHDRFYNPRGDRDHDGVPDRFERDDRQDGRRR